MGQRRRGAVDDCHLHSDIRLAVLDDDAFAVLAVYLLAYGVQTMKFDDAFTRLLGHEGGYVNHKSDPGGETKWGISKRSYPQLNIATLTEWDAKQIYRRDFWDKLNADELPEAVRFDVFDGAVNSGISQSSMWLQRAVGVDDDGVIGPKTLAACRVLAGSMVKARFNGHRLAFMSGLSSWPAFGRGWARRIADNLRAV